MTPEPVPLRWGNRPTPREVEEGRRWERPIGQRVGQVLFPGAELVALPAFSHLDTAFVRDGQLLAFLEVKTRAVARAAYRTTIVLWEKHTAAQLAQQYFHLPTYCAIAFTDWIAVFSLADPPRGKTYVQRRDRLYSRRLYALYDITDDRVQWIPREERNG